MSDAVRMWCLRHAESVNVTTGRAGVLPDAPLTTLGHREAAAAASVLSHENIVAVYCSTAVRAQQTADHIATVTGAEVHAVAALDEVGIGSAEGASDPVTRRQTADVLHAWVTGLDLNRRVADGENGHEVIERVSHELRSIAVRHPGEVVAVVGHVASLTVGLGSLCGLGPRVWGKPLPHAAPFLVNVEAGRWRCGNWPGIVPVEPAAELPV